MNGEDCNGPEAQVSEEERGVELREQNEEGNRVNQVASKGLNDSKLAGDRLFGGLRNVGPHVLSDIRIARNVVNKSNEEERNEDDEGVPVVIQEIRRNPKGFKVPDQQPLIPDILVEQSPKQNGLIVPLLKELANVRRVVNAHYLQQVAVIQKQEVSEGKGGLRIEEHYSVAYVLGEGVAYEVHVGQDINNLSNGVGDIVLIEHELLLVDFSQSR